MNEEWKKKFSRRLWTALIRQDMTQYELSEMTGISQGNICRYIHGERLPRLDTLMLMVDALDIDIHDLINF